MTAFLARRTPLTEGEADVLWEETSISTREARRGMGPSTYIQIKEITSGKVYFQQGRTATCED